MDFLNGYYFEILNFLLEDVLNYQKPDNKIHWSLLVVDFVRLKNEIVMPLWYDFFWYDITTIIKYKYFKYYDFLVFYEIFFPVINNNKQFFINSSFFNSYSVTYNNDSSSNFWFEAYKWKSELFFNNSVFEIINTGQPRVFFKNMVKMPSYTFFHNETNFWQDYSLYINNSYYSYTEMKDFMLRPHRGVNSFLLIDQFGTLLGSYIRNICEFYNITFEELVEDKNFIAYLDTQVSWGRSNLYSRVYKRGYYDPFWDLFFNIDNKIKDYLFFDKIPYRFGFNFLVNKGYFLPIGLKREHGVQFEQLNYFFFKNLDVSKMPYDSFEVSFLLRSFLGYLNNKHYIYKEHQSSWLFDLFDRKSLIYGLNRYYQSITGRVPNITFYKKISLMESNKADYYINVADALNKKKEILNKFFFQNKIKGVSFFDTIKIVDQYKKTRIFLNNIGLYNYNQYPNLDVWGINNEENRLISTPSIDFIDDAFLLVNDSFNKNVKLQKVDDSENFNDLYSFIFLPGFILLDKKALLVPVFSNMDLRDALYDNYMSYLFKYKNVLEVVGKNSDARGHLNYIVRNWLIKFSEVSEDFESQIDLLKSYHSNVYDFYFVPIKADLISNTIEESSFFENISPLMVQHSYMNFELKPYVTDYYMSTYISSINNQWKFSKTYIESIINFDEHYVVDVGLLYDDDEDYFYEFGVDDELYGDGLDDYSFMLDYVDFGLFIGTYEFMYSLFDFDLDIENIFMDSYLIKEIEYDEEEFSYRMLLSSDELEYLEEFYMDLTFFDLEELYADLKFLDLDWNEIEDIVSFLNSDFIEKLSMDTGVSLDFILESDRYIGLFDDEIDPIDEIQTNLVLLNEFDYELKEEWISNFSLFLWPEDYDFFGWYMDNVYPNDYLFDLYEYEWEDLVETEKMVNFVSESSSDFNSESDLESILSNRSSDLESVLSNRSSDLESVLSSITSDFESDLESILSNRSSDLESVLSNRSSDLESVLSNRSSDLESDLESILSNRSSDLESVIVSDKESNIIPNKEFDIIPRKESNLISNKGIYGLEWEPEMGSDKDSVYENDWESDKENDVWEADWQSDSEYESLYRDE